MFLVAVGFWNFLGAELEERPGLDGQEGQRDDLGRREERPGHAGGPPLK